MSWNRQIYVATASLGVYYTSNFTDPSVQPTWTAVNAGLPTLDCREFWLDPFEPANRQYVEINTSYDIYMRVGGGNWTVILSTADCRTLTGQTGGVIHSFCVDKNTPGRIWAVYGSTGLAVPPYGYYTLFSDNYGANWTVTTAPYGGEIQTHGLGAIRAQGDTVFVMCSTGTGGNARVYYSTNKGTSWAYTQIDYNAVHPIILNPYSSPLLVYTAYLTGGVGHTDNLASVDSSGSLVLYFQDFAPTTLDQMWFNPSNVNHQRYLRSDVFGNKTIWHTYDAWASTAASGTISGSPISFAPQAGNEIDNIFVGLVLGTHVIGCLTGEADTTATGIAGTNAGSAPYTDSIPNTCGGACSMGIQAIPLVGNLYIYDVLFESAVNDDSVHLIGVVLQVETNNDLIHTSNVAME